MKLKCRRCTSQRVPTMLLSPVRNPASVPSLCDDRRQRPHDPTYVLADPPVEIRWLDSKPKLFAPSDVQASVPHSNRGPNAVYIRFLFFFLTAAADVKSWTRLFQLWSPSCHSNDRSVSEGGATMERHSFRNETSRLTKWSLYTCILAIFVYDCDGVPWPQHPLSQVLLVVALNIWNFSIAPNCNRQQLMICPKVAQVPGQSLQRIGYHVRNVVPWHSATHPSNQFLPLGMDLSNLAEPTPMQRWKTFGSCPISPWPPQFAVTICNVPNHLGHVELPTELANAHGRKPLTSPDLQSKLCFQPRSPCPKGYLLLTNALPFFFLDGNFRLLEFQDIVDAM